MESACVEESAPRSRRERCSCLQGSSGTGGQTAPFGVDFPDFNRGAKAQWQDHAQERHSLTSTRLSADLLSDLGEERLLSTTLPQGAGVTLSLARCSGNVSTSPYFGPWKPRSGTGSSPAQVTSHRRQASCSGSTVLKRRAWALSAASTPP